MSDGDSASFAGDLHLPRHIAIIMDGNGRWARSSDLPRAAGHRRGVKALKTIVEHCAHRRIEVLTVFAFSSENWQRPQQEVGLLMELFMTALDEEVDALHRNEVRLRFIGDQSAFPSRLCAAIRRAEQKTAGNTGLVLVVAANYGGRWDIARACRRVAELVDTGDIPADGVDEDLFRRYLSLSALPEPDLFIRTGGERRISNFLIWELAYTELYFTDVLWPEFNSDELERALAWYRERERRFGRTPEQIAP